MLQMAVSSCSGIHGTYIHDVGSDVCNEQSSLLLRHTGTDESSLPMSQITLTIYSMYKFLAIRNIKKINKKTMISECFNDK